MDCHNFRKPHFILRLLCKQFLQPCWRLHKLIHVSMVYALLEVLIIHFDLECIIHFSNSHFLSNSSKLVTKELIVSQATLIFLKTMIKGLLQLFTASYSTVNILRVSILYAEPHKLLLKMACLLKFLSELLFPLLNFHKLLIFSLFLWIRLLIIVVDYNPCLFHDLN